MFIYSFVKCVMQLSNILTYIVDVNKLKGHFHYHCVRLTHVGDNSHKCVALQKFKFRDLTLSSQVLIIVRGNLL